MNGKFIHRRSHRVIKPLGALHILSDCVLDQWGNLRRTVCSKPSAPTLALTVFTAFSVGVAVVHHWAHLIRHSRTSLATAEKTALSNHVRHVALCQLALRSCYHVSCLGSDYECEVVGMSEIATYFRLTLIDVSVDWASLRIKQVFVWHLDLFDPLLSLPHAVLHIELPNVDKNVDPPSEQFWKHSCWIQISVLDSSSDGAVEFAEGLCLGNVKCRFKFSQLQRRFEHGLESVLLSIFGIEDSAIHLVYTSC